MAAERVRQSIAVHSSQPLVGLFDEDDADIIRYFADDANDIQATVEPSLGGQAAINVIGAWSDMDWDELSESLDRIRHESAPTPPIDDLRGC